jgi:O-antigen/teichoic acid export membrane protein
LTALHARGQNQHLVQVRRSLTKFNVWIVGALTFGMFPFLPWIYPSWTAGRLMLDEWTLVFLMIRLLIWSMWSASMTLLLATNRHQLVPLILLGAATVTSLLAMALVPVMGISGAALAALLGDLGFSAWLIPSLASREMGEPPGGFLAEASRAMGAVGIPVLLAVAAWFLVPFSPVRYGVILPMSAGIAAAMMWRGLVIPERQLIVRLFHEVSAKAPFRSLVER